jgi:hypothetical protein
VSVSDKEVFADVLRTASKLLAVEAARRRHGYITQRFAEGTDSEVLPLLNASARCLELADRYAPGRIAP